MAGMLGSAVSLPNGFASSTKKNATQMCTYTFSEQNSKVKHDGSCAGVLSDTCLKSIQTLQQELRFPENGCPGLGDGALACGDAFSIGLIDLAAEDNCTSDLGSALPGVPKDYRSYEILNKLTPTHHRLDMPKEFDAQIGMPVPVLLFFSLQQEQDGQPQMQHNSQLLCVAPVNVTEGDQAFGSGAVNLRAPRDRLWL
ncbi:hypothetical protein NLG97_g3860 [Lecanicillium saksenae]|uniref:Uncharacterized protein n=1 Tax=Lecanicillium saksenae TaxID=468837 RepID=A0ACC1QX48_9HYPO|nr:hypothetical protein NLG97_g3860 [Lecanicillium saksenae]